MRTVIIFLLINLAGCTYLITQSNSKGNGSEVVQEEDDSLPVNSVTEIVKLTP